MKLNYSASVIFVKDIETSKNFYNEFLGLEIEHDFGKNVSFYGGLAIWELREEHIVPQKLQDRMLKHGNRFELYFETSNIKDTLEKLASHKVEFLHEMHEEPWGQFTTRFFDPDGHLIEIGESLQTFVKRMKDDGMTIEEINKKTYIPVENVIELLK